MGLSRYALLSPELLIQLRYRLTAENFRKASADLVAGWRRRAVWGTQGLREIRERQRGSRMGPFWSLIPLGAMLCLFGIIYGRVLDRNLADYLPYLAAGLIVWNLISGLLLDAERAFIMADGSGKRLRAPFSIAIYRIAWVNLIILGYNLPLFLLVALWFGKNPGWGLVLALPALLRPLAERPLVEPPGRGYERAFPGPGAVPDTADPRSVSDYPHPVGKGDAGRLGHPVGG